MKRLLFLAFVLFSWLLVPSFTYADETVTVTATNVDISENLDLRMVATLFGQAKDLEEFEQLLNNPDSAYSNLDLNGDGDVDYLRVVETANDNRHLVVIQAVLAKDIYQDVASIFVEKDSASEAVTVQVIGDEYIYGDNYVIEPVYIYRPLIYDWFWGSSWVCWHSPYYWGYWPGWWYSYHSIAHHLYWEHMYWHHHHHPICSYRTTHHHHPHYAPMRKSVTRTDYAMRHPDRSFAMRNASRQITSARQLEHNRRATMTQPNASTRSNARGGQNPSIRLSTSSSSRQPATMNRTFGSSNVRKAATTRTVATPTRTSAATATRTSATTATRTSAATPTSTATATAARTTTTMRSGSSATVPSRTSSSAVRPSASSSNTMRSASSTSMRSAAPAPRSSAPVVRSASSTTRTSAATAPTRTAGARR